MGHKFMRTDIPRTRRALRSPLRVSWIALLGTLALAGCAGVPETTAPAGPLSAAEGGPFGGDPLQNAAIHPGTEEDGIASAAYWASRFERQPHKPQNAVRYSQSLRSLKSYDRALELMRQAMAMHPAEPKVLGEYGKVLASAGRGEEAIATLERAAALDPSDWRLQSALGVALDQASEHREAQKRYRHGLKISPRNPAILNNLGLSHALDGDLGEAELVLRQAAGQGGATAQTRENLALVLRLKGDLAGARSLASARQTPALESVYAPKLRATLSRAPVRQGTLPQAANPLRAPAPQPAAASPRPAPAPAAPKPAPAQAPAPVLKAPKPILPDTDKIMRELPSANAAPYKGAPRAASPVVPQHAKAAPKEPLAGTPRVERVRAPGKPRLIVPEFLAAPQEVSAPALRGGAEVVPSAIEIKSTN